MNVKKDAKEKAANPESASLHRSSRFRFGGLAFCALRWTLCFKSPLDLQNKESRKRASFGELLIIEQFQIFSEKVGFGARRIARHFPAEILRNAQILHRMAQCTENSQACAAR